MTKINANIPVENLKDKTMAKKELNLVTEMSKTECGIKDIVDVYFDLTLIINEDNEAILIDNSVEDWKDFVDCSTVIAKQIKVRHRV